VGSATPRVIERLRELGAALMAKAASAREKLMAEKQLVAVYEAGGKKYTISETDALWLARMVVGEGGTSASERKKQALLWAILQRYMLQKGFRAWRSLAAVTRAFSQPINPIWDGIRDALDAGQTDMCAPGGKYYGKPECSQTRLDRRKHVTALSWSQIPKHIQESVRLFQRGELPYPSGVSQRINNWASYPSVRQLYPWGQDIDGDWFLEDKGTLDFDVIVNEKIWREISSAGFILPTMLKGLAIGGVLATAGFFIARRFL